MDTSMNQAYQQQQHSFGLTRYASAPSSFFENLIGSSGGRGIDSTACEDIRYPQSANPVSEDMFTGFAPSDGSGNLQSMHKYGERFVEQEERGNAFQQNGYMNNGTQMLYHNSQVNGSQNVNPENTGNTMRGPYSENMLEQKISAGNCSNLARQSSSPAEFFSNLSAENGFAVDGMNSQVNFSNGSSTSSNTKRHRLSNFSSDIWDDCASHFAKRPKDINGNNISAVDSFEIQDGSRDHHTLNLTHHLSIPITFGEVEVAEKFLSFQDAAPCKIRAKRGFATHPRSIAERVRRTRISERIRKLQELFPNIDKHTNTSDMLETAVGCIKNLQIQVKALTDAKAKCLCHSKQEQ